MKKILPFLCLFLWACTSSPSPMGKPLPHLDYSALTPYTVKSGYVEVRRSYQKYDRPQQASFVRSPDIAMENYAFNRFQVQGDNRRMVFDIQKLNLTKRDEKLKYYNSLFGNERHIYNFELFISLIPIDQNSAASAPYTISIDRELVIMPDLSVAEKEFRQFEFLEKIMNDIDAAVTNIVGKLNAQ